MESNKTYKVDYKGNNIEIDEPDTWKHRFYTHTYQHNLTVPTHDKGMILRASWALFPNGNLPSKPVRLIGIGISGWQQTESEPVQADLFSQPQKRTIDDRLRETIGRAADRFGKGILQLGFTPKSKKLKP